MKKNTERLPVCLCVWEMEEPCWIQYAGSERFESWAITPNIITKRRIILYKDLNMRASGHYIYRNGICSFRWGGFATATVFCTFYLLGNVPRTSICHGTYFELDITRCHIFIFEAVFSVLSVMSQRGHTKCRRSNNGHWWWRDAPTRLNSDLIEYNCRFIVNHLLKTFAL